jgi:hypothetical protein
MKNSNDAIGNQTRDLPTCSAVFLPTALACAPHRSYQFFSGHIEFISSTCCRSVELQGFDVIHNTTAVCLPEAINTKFNICISMRSGGYGSLWELIYSTLASVEKFL